MVAILDAAEEPLTKFSFPIEKARTEVDPKTGDVIVYGKATDCTVDTDDQIVDERWAAKAVKDWLDSGGNVRVQHNPLRDPAGVGIEAHGDGKGGQWVRARIFEPIAKLLVLGGALRAFSIGVMHPVVVSDPIAKNGRILGGIIGEISLVDRPANKNCDIEYQLVKMAKDGLPSWVGKMLGNVTPILTKMGGSIDPATMTLPGADASDEDIVTVDLPANATVMATPRDLKKLLDAKHGAEKRQFDRGVGGGVDRDKLPESDFAGPNRSYPIVTPADVEDAGGLIGHADDPEGVKRRIIAIAHRKGPEFVAKIPESWKKGDEKEKSVDEPEVAKAGAKKCPKCGKNFHSDSKLRNCDGCGADLPHADKAADTEAGDAVEKSKGGDDAKKPKPGGGDGDSDGDDDADDGDTGDTDGDDMAVKGDALPAGPSIPKPKKGKVVKSACNGCGGMVKSKNKFCPKCGMAVGKPDLEKKGVKVDVEKGKPTPDEGVTGDPSPAPQPVPAHREPDGEAVEAFEHSASLPTDPDSAFKTAMRHRELNVPGDLGVVHDLLCPAYHPAVADHAHPGRTLKGIDVHDWQLKAFDAAASGTFEEAEHATKRWQHASTVASCDLDTLTELRFEAHKAFKDANPGPGSFPTPSSITPGQFRRPYLTAGHARPSRQQEGPNTATVPTGQVSAAQFDRGFLNAGRAADSPANKGADYPIQPPTEPGQLTPVRYQAALKANVGYAMDVMHDHIAQTFPDLCPMAPSHGPAGRGPVGGAPAMTPVPAPVGKSAKVDEKPVVTEEPAVEKAATETAPAFENAQMADVIKSLLAEALQPVVDELAATKAELKAQKKANKRLKEVVDAVASQTDENTAPFRGQAMPGALKSFGQPVAAPNAADIAARSQLMLQQELENQWRNADSPSEREAAWAALMQSRGMR